MLFYNLTLLDKTVNGRVVLKADHRAEIVYRIPAEACRNAFPDPVYEQHLQSACLYVLVGESEAGLPLCYVGQADRRHNGKAVLQRLIEHRKSKPWWRQALVLTRQGESLEDLLNTLEYGAWELARKAKVYSVDNAKAPHGRDPNVRKRAGSEQILKEAAAAFAILGYPVFGTPGGDSERKTEPQARPMEREPELSWTPVYLVHEEGEARGLVSPDGSQIRVLAGSCFHSRRDRDYLSSSFYAQRDALAMDANHCLLEDVVFTSLSGAAKMVLCRSANGKVSWKRADGRPYDDSAVHKRKPNNLVN